MKYVEGRPAGLSRQEIYKIAEKFARRVRYRLGAPLEPVVKRLGGRINYGNTGNTGSVVVHGPRKFDIFLSQNARALRDRFTIAHGLGHYCLHSDYGKLTISQERKGSGMLEWEANWFATGMLMPTDAFKYAYSRTTNIKQLKACFLVSEEAISVRIKELGLGS